LSGTPAEVTQILHDWSAGDGSAPERLIPLVYDELRRLAQSYLHQERTDHTLQATALVHEAYLRLVDQTHVSINSRAHFFGVAAHLMRQILVDHARAHGAQKRGGAATRLSLDEARFEPEHQAADLLALDEALLALAQVDERKSKIVEMRFFGGLAEKEIAVVLDVSEKTVARDWQVAKLWLYRELAEGSSQ
jgi:RNA polymerase sigma factor (TIGR02999 family)